MTLALSPDMLWWLNPFQRFQTCIHQSNQAPYKKKSVCGTGTFPLSHELNCSKENWCFSITPPFMEITQLYMWLGGSVELQHLWHILTRYRPMHKQGTPRWGMSPPKSAGQSKFTPVWKEWAQLLTVCQTPCVVAQARKPGLSRLWSCEQQLLVHTARLCSYNSALPILSCGTKPAESVGDELMGGVEGRGRPRKTSPAFSCYINKLWQLHRGFSWPQHSSQASPFDAPPLPALRYTVVIVQISLWMEWAEAKAAPGVNTPVWTGPSSCSNRAKLTYTSTTSFQLLREENIPFFFSLTLLRFHFQAAPNLSPSLIPFLL